MTFYQLQIKRTFSKSKALLVLCNQIVYYIQKSKNIVLSKIQVIIQNFPTVSKMSFLTDSNQDLIKVHSLSFMSLCEWVSEVAQSCPTLCDPMDRSLPGSSIRGIFQARVLEWGAITFSVYWCSLFFFQLRSLGVHFSKVRSLTLDTWEPELLKVK